MQCCDDGIKSVIKWRAPSNIALIKYWGKYGRQLPQNPSMSLTLTSSFTDAELSYELRDGKRGSDLETEFFFEGISQPFFHHKIDKFLHSILDIFPFLLDYKLKISTENSFPHSAGIASSASSMAALSLCLCCMERRVTGKPFDLDDQEFWQKASMVARLGSGSACRSLYGGIVTWGESFLSGSSNEWATPFPFPVHPEFQEIQDAILIVDSTPKKVSSRVGHGLMSNHPYASIRFERARNNLSEISSVLQSGDWEQFSQIVEKEAFELHGLMMTSSPPYLLWKPHTVSLIQEVQRLRVEKHIPICFTLDAGPNIHLLYPKKVALQVEEVITSSFLTFCEEGKWSKDILGKGPICLKER